MISTVALCLFSPLQRSSFAFSALAVATRLTTMRTRASVAGEGDSSESVPAICCVEHCCCAAGAVDGGGGVSTVLSSSVQAVGVRSLDGDAGGVDQAGVDLGEALAVDGGDLGGDDGVSLKRDGVGGGGWVSCMMIMWRPAGG